MSKKDMKVVSKEVIEKVPLKNNFSTNELRFDSNYFKTGQPVRSQFKKKDKKSVAKTKLKKKLLPN